MNALLNELLNTNRVTEPTRRAITERLEAKPDAQPVFFTESEFETLIALVDVLLPRSPRPAPREVAIDIDARLASGEGNGWRYDHLPPDGEMHRQALLGLDQAVADPQSRFTNALWVEKESVVASLQKGDIAGEVWHDLSPTRVYEEILAEVVESYTAFPSVWTEMNYTGYADAQGWEQVGLNAPSDNVSQIPLPVVAPDPTPTPKTQHPTPAPDEVCDVVIVGTGAGGAPILARLAQAGLSVIALEAGTFWDPADFATDEQVQAKRIFWMGERLSAGNDPVPFGTNNSGTGVGGSTLHFTAYTPRPHPDDFRLYTEEGVGADWPIGYEDLEPYLTEAEQFLGVSGPAAYPWGGARSREYSLAPLPLNGAAQLMERGCARLGVRTSPAPNAALSGPYFQAGVGWRNACTNRGFCQAGCSTGAKASMDVTYVRLALAHGAKVFSESFVTKIETDPTGRVTGVVYTRDDKEQRVQCRHAAFLCAGAIETPRLLLLNNLGNETGQVGRNFMAHPGLQLWAQFEETVHPNRGIPGGLISEDTHRPRNATPDLLREGAGFAGGYLLQSIGVMPVTYASQLARGEGLHGDALLDHLRGYNNVAGINILGEGLPYAHNYLELAGETDERGLPKPRVHYTAGENEARMTQHADRVMRAIWNEAGASKAVWSFPRFAHTLGTCRMGDDPRTSVVSSDCRVHTVPNLYVCDNSVFASALAVNPALTQVALALRTADRFLAASRRGEN